MEQIDIIRINDGKEENIKDVIAEEVPVTIYVNGDEIVTLLSSPQNLEELALGFLFSSGMISAGDKIEGVFADTFNWKVEVLLKDRKIDSGFLHKRMFTSGCGGGTLFYKEEDSGGKPSKRITLNKENILKIMRDFQDSSEGFKETGCLHAAALSDGEELLVVREDIGRHNAIDKVLGYAFSNDISLEDKSIYTSGRVSSEVILKMRNTSVPVIVSRSAPTNRAVKSAKETGITLIGFVRGKRMNIYNTVEERRLV